MTTTTTTTTNTTTTTTAPTTTTTAPTTTTTAAPHPPLAGVVVRPPAGFALSTRSSIHNGRLGAAQFNTWQQSPTVATDLHYIGGYQVTFDSRTGRDWIQLSLLDFATSDDAVNFVHGLPLVNATNGGSIDPVIPGAYDWNLSKANSDGGHNHAVVASKGTRAMLIYYTTGGASPPPLLAPMAKQQYYQM